MGFRVGTLECPLRVEELRRSLASHSAALSDHVRYLGLQLLARPRSVRSRSVSSSYAQVASQPARLVRLQLMQLMHMLRVLRMRLLRFVSHPCCLRGAHLLIEDPRQ